MCSGNRKECKCEKKCDECLAEMSMYDEEMMERCVICGCQGELDAEGECEVCGGGCMSDQFDEEV
jgi:hypothetical protein